MVKDNIKDNKQQINYKNTWRNSHYPNKKNSNKSQHDIDNCTEILKKLHMNNNQKKNYGRNKNEGHIKSADSSGDNINKKNYTQKQFQNSSYSPQIHPQLNVVRHIMMQEKIWPYTYCKIPSINFILPHLLNKVVYVVYPGYGIHRSNPNIQIPKPKDNPCLKHLSCFNCGASGHVGNDCKEPTMEELLLHDSYRLNYLSTDMHFHNIVPYSTSSSSSCEKLDNI